MKQRELIDPSTCKISIAGLVYVGVSKNYGYPQIHFCRFSTINHPFWGTTIFGNTHVETVSFFHPRKKWSYDFYHFVFPRCSPYAIFTYICDEFMVDVSKYSIDGAYVFFWKPVWFYHEIAKSGSIQPKTLNFWRLTSSCETNYFSFSFQKGFFFLP